MYDEAIKLTNLQTEQVVVVELVTKCHMYMQVLQCEFNIIVMKMELRIIMRRDLS